MKRLALIIAAATATIISAAIVVVRSDAQEPGPPTGSLELVSHDDETRFTFVDNPPRRRERAGDLFVINSRLRDSSNRPAGRLHATFAEIQPPPRVIAQGSATFRLGDGQIWSAARSSIRDRATEPTRSQWWAAPAPTPQRAERW
jgi:hypothetical protein